jgi:anthranilate phosphoribosyltransferase
MAERLNKMADERRRSNDVELAGILTTLKFINEGLAEIKGDVKSMKDDVKECYVTKVEFDPIKRLVYGAVGVILLAVIGAVIALVVKR